MLWFDWSDTKQIVFYRYKWEHGETLNSPEVKRGEADFISTQFSLWSVGDCVVYWLWHWQYWLESWCEMNWHVWTTVRSPFRKTSFWPSEWGQCLGVKKIRACVSVKCGDLNRKIMPRAICSAEPWMISLYTLHRRSEIVSEWVLMLGGEEKGETDTLIKWLWLNVAEIERERKNN